MTRHLGMTWGFCARRGYLDSERARRDLDAMAALGVNSVCLTPTVFQERVSHPRVFADFACTPADDEIIRAIEAIHARGMACQLRPMIEGFDGRGRMQVWFARDGERIPGKRSERWARWFETNTARSVHYARIAERTGCEHYGLDSELDLTVGRHGEWRALLAAVRAVYHGPVNTCHTPQVDFLAELARRDHWLRDLDGLSISAYLKAADGPRPGVAGLLPRLAEQRQHWKQVAAAYGKPFWFGEAGCTSSTGGAISPSGWQGNGVYDGQEQADWLEAILQTFWDEPWWGGLYWWKWDEQNHRPAFNDDARGDKGFTLDGKPAAEVMRRWFTRAGAPRILHAPPPPACAECALPAAPPAKPVLARQVGMTWGFYARPGYFDSARATADVAGMKALGINQVCLVATVMAEAFDDPRDSHDFQHTPGDDEILRAIGLVQQAGMAVMLRPMRESHDGLDRCAVWFPPDGERIPGRRSDGWARWRDGMVARTRHYARLAERTGCSAYSIDSELDRTVAYAGEWRAILAAARNEYRGPVNACFTGGVDFARELARPDHWWRELDELGFSFYAGVGEAAGKGVEAMKTALLPVRERWRAIAKAYGKPISWGELGCCSSAGAARHPSGWQGAGGYDGREQADYLEAVLTLFWDEPWWSGFHWWKWDEQNDRVQFRDDPAGDKGFILAGKPAAEVLARWAARRG